MSAAAAMGLLPPLRSARVCVRIAAAPLDPLHLPLLYALLSEAHCKLDTAPLLGTTESSLP
jgi:hypothetical protein